MGSDKDITAPKRPIGQTLGGRYKLIDFLGEGGMGSVFVAHDKQVRGRQVAVKVLRATDGVENEARFRRETEILGRLDHPNIVVLHDVGITPDGRPYYVMERLRGKSLAAQLVYGPMPLSDAVAVLKQCCDAASCAHGAGVVHRDLKPANIFLQETCDDSISIKVLDFGIAKIAGSMTIQTETLAFIGTPQFMSPEQARAEHESISPRSDIFSLGAIGYALVAGTQPFTGSKIHEMIYQVLEHHPTPLADLNIGCPQALSNAVAKAMAKRPLDRFATANEFAAALRSTEPVALSQSSRTAANAKVKSLGADEDTDRAEVPGSAPTMPLIRHWKQLAALAAILSIAIAGWIASATRVSFDLDERRAHHRAIAGASAGLSAMAAGHSVGTLDPLLAAYRAGDNRRATTASLHHALLASDAWVSTQTVAGEVTDLVATASGFVAIIGGEVRVDGVGPSLAELAVSYMAVSADGRWLALLARDGTLHVHTVAGGPPVATAKNVRAVHWLDDGRLLFVSFSAESWPALATIRASRVSDRQLIDDIAAIRCEVADPLERTMASDDGQWLLACGELRSIVESNRPRELAPRSTGPQQLSTTGKYVLSHLDNQLVVIATSGAKDTGALTLRASTPLSGAEDLAIAPLSDELVVAIDRFSLSSFAIDDQPLRVRRRWQRAMTAPITAWARYGERALVVATSEGMLDVIDAETGVIFGRWRAHDGAVTTLSARGNDLWSGAGRVIKRWNLAALRARFVHSQPTAELAVSPSGDSILMRVGEQFHLLDAASGESHAIDSRGTLTATPGGQRVVIGGSLLDVEDGRVIARHSFASDIASTSEHGDVLVDSDGRVYVRNGGYFEQSRPRERLAPKFHATAVNQSGELLVHFGSNSGVVVQSRKDGAVLARLEGSAVIGWFADETVLVRLAGPDRVVLWDWRSSLQQEIGRELARWSQSGRHWVLSRDDAFDRWQQDAHRTTSPGLCQPQFLRINARGLVAGLCRDRARIVVWDGESAAWFHHHASALHVLDFAIAPDGSAVYLAGNNGVLSIDVGEETRDAAVIDERLAKLMRIL